MQQHVNLITLSPTSPALFSSASEIGTGQIFSRVALVSMPWGSIRKPALAIPILKGCAQRAGFTTDVHLLTLRFAELIGIEAYEALADRPFYPEWFFSQHLFGREGSGEIQNAWDQMKADPAAQSFRDGVLRSVNGSEELLNRIALEHVPRFISDCIREIPWGRFGAIGFTTTFAQSFSSVLLAKHIKELYPDTAIIFGGANVDGEMGVEFLNAFPWVDHVVHGEGEVVFPQLLRSLASGRKERIASVSSRVGSTILPGDTDQPPFVDLNQAPVPDYSDYMDALEKSSFRRNVAVSLFFESSRGCWWGAKHHCTFCGLNAMGMAYRKKNSQKVFEEILEITSSTKCLNLFATDNILPLEYFHELMPRLAEADIDINMFYEVKANLTRTQMQLLADAGVRTIQPGIESFSTNLLTHMQKGITAIQNIQFVKWCRELGISAAYNILFGFPGERPEDYATYPQLFRSLHHLQPPINMGPVIFERFSPYHFDHKRFGLDLEADASYAYVYPKERVALDRIAYFFQERGGNQASREYIAPVLAAYEEWKKSWKDTVFSYKKGPGYVVLQDNRHLGSEEQCENPMHHRSTTISEPGASIYLFCDQNRSLPAICKMIREKFGTRYPERLIELILNDFVKRQLMFLEDNRYLALAVRSKLVKQMESPI